MRLSLVFAICTAFFFALRADVSLAQTNYSGYNSPKSERACYKCCRRWQARMGWSANRLDVCTVKVHDRDGPQLLTSLRRFNLARDVVPLVAFFDLKGFEQ